MFDHAFHNYLQHGFPMVSCDAALVICDAVLTHGT